MKLVEFTPDNPLTPEAMAQFLPHGSLDVERAQALVDLGLPTVRAAVPAMLAWLDDPNDALLHVFFPFLISVADQIVPELRDLLEERTERVDARAAATHLALCKATAISGILGAAEDATLSALLPALEALAREPSDDEALHGVHLEAAFLLGERGLGDGALVTLRVAEVLDLPIGQVSMEDDLTTWQIVALSDVMGRWDREEVVPFEKALVHWSRHVRPLLNFRQDMDRATLALALLLRHGLGDGAYNEGTRSFLKRFAAEQIDRWQLRLDRLEALVVP